MSNRSKPIEVIGIDNVTLEKDMVFQEGYAFFVKLSDEPDPLWRKYLLEWKNALHSMNREIRVEGDKLRLVFAYGDNIQNYVKYVTLLIKMINERIEKHNKQVELEEKRKMVKQEFNQLKEDEIRKQLSDLEL